MDSYSSSTSDDYCVIGSKKVKLDPDFTPRKYEKAKEEIAMYQNTVKRITALNLRLQEKIIDLEEKNDDLEMKVREFEGEMQELKTICKRKHESELIVKIIP